MIRITRGGNLIIVTNGDIDNSGVISAANIYNQNGEGLAYGSLLNAAGSLTSGLLSGGGFGFTISKEKQRDEYAKQNSEQIGSTVSSVTIGGSKAKGEVDANSTAYNESSVTANKDLSFTSGSDTNIQGGKLSGEKVTGSVGGDLNIESKQDGNNYTEKNTAGGFGLEINLDNTAKISGSGVTGGASSSNIDSNYSSVTEQSGIYAGEEGFDIYVGSNIQGSSVSGENISLDAKENLNVTASANTNVTEQSSKSSSASVGVGIDLSTGMINSVTIGGSKARGEVDANSTAYNESSVTANKDLSFTSGSDTNIQGGKLSGEKVTGSVGGDLNIESKQDRNNYTEKNTAGGFGLEINLDNTAKISGSGVTGSVGTSNIDSQYSSVTEQSGIYAGEEGFDIRVEKNTDLKGGVIASEAEAEKNKLSTGTLTWEDIHNKSEYEAGGIGANVNINNGADYNEKGVTPNIGMPAADEAESTTKAAIAEGTIEIRDKENQKQDVSQLNRDTQNSLNKLGEIFDKDNIKERQELAGLFGELAYNKIHEIADKNGWAEGSAEKNDKQALVGGIMSELGGSGFLAGASGAMVNEMIQDKLSEMFKDDPAMHQWASALIGGVVAEIVANNAQAGASTAVSGTKNNLLWEYIPEFRKSIKDVDVSDLPEGYCRVLSFGGGEIVSGSDAALVFNTDNQDVFSSFDITVGPSASFGPVSTTVGVGWLEDKNGKLVTDASVIKTQMQGWSWANITSTGGGMGSYTNAQGYTFKTKFISNVVGASTGFSNTTYLGTKEEVSKGEIHHE